MLENLKLVLIQHKKFLVIFFVVIFLPSVILAFFGIRAIHNERYKLKQQNLDQQKQFVRSVQVGIRSLIERDSLSLKELSSRKAIFDQDYRAISNLITQRLRDESLFGQTVIWNYNDPPWFPGLQQRPPAANTLVVPEEWRKWQPDLEKAERAEFRRKNFSEAINLYNQILNRAEDDQVKAWILGRVGRCEVKYKKFKQALIIYRSILADFPDLRTESGRPLNLVSALEMLNVLRLDKNYDVFFRESLKTYNQLVENVWSLDGDQVKLYTTMLKNMIGEVVAENSLNGIPDEYSAAVDDIQDLIEKELEIWRMAEAVRRNILPSTREKLESLSSDTPQVQKNVFEFEDNDILVLLIRLGRNGSGQYREFLGSLLRISDLTEAIDALIIENSPPGVSVLLRSTLSENVVFGDADESQGSPVITDFFPENFPPWRLELYQSGGGESGFFLYKNIFFWTILALLFILFFGSGLIIRTIIHEVNLLNLKSEFIASVSHEFKTPLTSMGGIIERLLDNEVKDPDKAQEYYRILSHDSERLKRLVKNVLDFTKIEEGKREYKLASTDIVELVCREVESFEKENESDSYKVGIERGDDIPSVFVDEEAMSQALRNILDNAVKFSGQEKKINVQIVRKENSVEIAVRDRGIGIPDNEQKRIFEKFYRGKQASSVSPTGTGLGLTLVKHIVDSHGGDVLVKSQLGEGSCVSLILPTRKGE
ncbi:MAG: HAMP domain-containing histidine kinase [Candidatus Aminicenantes bacterium]|nr:MAG: HAMP domain-containing histidine kinase [Candidatus Aminicenantes bacterium]